MLKTSEFLLVMLFVIRWSKPSGLVLRKGSLVGVTVTQSLPMCDIPGLVCSLSCDNKPRCQLLYCSNQKDLAANGQKVRKSASPALIFPLELVSTDKQPNIQSIQRVWCDFAGPQPAC